MQTRGFCLPKRLGFRTKTIISMVALILYAAPVLAQLSITDTQELRKKQQREEEERERQLKAPDVRLQKEKPEKETFDLPEESPCFQITTIQLDGDKDGKFSWLNKQLSPYPGRCIGHEGINLIVQRLTGRIISSGYVTTRIGIPEQDISAGTLRLVLIPGVIRSIRFSDEKLRGLWQTAFPARPGDLLNLRDLEQGLEQMKRVPYQDADLDIKPGELPGESDVLIILKRQKPWRASLSIDDTGSKSTGKLQAAASLSLDNPLGINDLFSVSYNHDVSNESGKGTHGDGLYYSFPYGYWTSAVSVNDYYYHQTVTGLTGPFVYSGTNTVADVNVQRLVHRDQVSKTSLSFGITKRWAKTYLIVEGDIEEIESQRRDVTSAQIGLYHRRYLGNVMLDINLNYRQGVPWLSAQSDPVSGLSGAAPTTRYQIETLDVNLNVPFTMGTVPMRYVNHSRAQYTQDTLFVSDQFGIGNRNTVRGFDGEQTLMAEQGWFTRNEIGIPLFKSSHEFYVGIDHGEVSGPSADLLPDTQLTGCVIGLRGSFSGKFQSLSYDVFSGWPLSKPDQLQTAEPASGFQVTYQF